MSLRLTGAPDARATRTTMFLTAGAGVVGLGIAGVFLWAVFGGTPASAEKLSPGATKLVERSAGERAERAREAERLRQKEIGEDYQFDGNGNLLGARADATDLPQNRLLAAAKKPVPEEGVPRSEIAQGIRRTSESPGDGNERGAATEREDRALLVQPMLGYSTVRGAGWAARRPEVNPEKPDRPAETAPAEERVLSALERSLGAGTPSGGGGGGVVAMPVGAVAGGPAAAGEGLYPAQKGAQVFRVGGVGDMRIGGGIGPDGIVRQGKFLDCVLVNELRVDLVESPVIAMVSRDFVGLDGNHVLVPAGAKLLGSAGQVGNLQQARVYIRFERIIFPDQRSAYFPTRQVSASDAAGAVGLPGDVDRHLLLQFGAAIVLGVLDGLAGAVQAPGTGSDPAVRELVAARTSSNFSAVVAGILARYANVVPTVTVEPGAKLKVFFAEDVQLSPYMKTADLSWVRRVLR